MFDLMSTIARGRGPIAHGTAAHTGRLFGAAALGFALCAAGCSMQVGSQSGDRGVYGDEDAAPSGSGDPGADGEIGEAPADGTGAVSGDVSEMAMPQDPAMQDGALPSPEQGQPEPADPEPVPADQGSDTGSSMGSGGTGGDAAQSGISQVPATSHCNSVADWDPTWTQYEDEVLVHVNDARATGYNCDSEGRFGATTPLKMDPALRCAARLHSRYMGETGDINHVTRTGSDPFDRIEEAGYRFWTAGENIAYGSPTPSDVVDGWLDSDGHCRNIMAPDFEDIGVGYFPVIEDNRWGSREAPYWTQAFGSAR